MAFLGYYSHLPGNFYTIYAVYILIIQEHSPQVGVLSAADGLEEGCFAGTVGPYNTQESSLPL